MSPRQLRAAAVACGLTALLTGVLGLAVDLATLAGIGAAAGVATIALLRRASDQEADPDHGTVPGPPINPTDPTSGPPVPATGSGPATPESPGPPGA